MTTPQENTFRHLLRRCEEVGPSIQLDAPDLAVHDSVPVESTALSLSLRKAIVVTVGGVEICVDVCAPRWSIVSLLPLFAALIGMRTAVLAIRPITIARSCVMGFVTILSLGQ